MYPPFFILLVPSHSPDCTISQVGLYHLTVRIIPFLKPDCTMSQAGSYHLTGRIIYISRTRLFVELLTVPPASGPAPGKTASCRERCRSYRSRGHHWGRGGR